MTNNQLSAALRMKSVCCTTPAEHLAAQRVIIAAILAMNTPADIVAVADENTALFTLLSEQKKEVEKE